MGRGYKGGRIIIPRPISSPIVPGTFQDKRDKILKAGVEPNEVNGLLLWCRPDKGITKVGTQSAQLINGKMESGDPPTGWSLYGASGSISRSTEQRHSGTYSLKLTPGGAGPSCGAKYIMNVTKDLGYCFRGYYYAVSGGSTTMMASLRRGDDAGSCGSWVFDVENAWTYFCIYGIQTTTGAAGGPVISSGDRVVYMDDLEVVEVPLVTSWVELAQGLTASQATLTKKPGIHSSLFNGHPGILGDGGHYLDMATALSALDKYTFFGVGFHKKKVTSDSTWLGGATNTNAIGTDGDAGQVNTNVAVSDNAEYMTLAKAHVPLANPFGTLITVVRNGDDFKLYQNGQLCDEQTFVGTTPSEFQFVARCQEVYGTYVNPARALRGGLAEMALFGKILGNRERSLIEDYFQSRYRYIQTW